jgi:hypothetical protein
MSKFAFKTLAVNAVLVSFALAQSGTPANSPAPSQPPSASPASAGMAPSATASADPGPRFPHTKMSSQALRYYEMIWGIDSLGVRAVESGELVRFTYRVVDPAKAKGLNDKKKEPFLVDPQAGVKLVVPSLEKVGQLRQSSTPIAGMSYWMAFSNPGRRVKRGDHVVVVIGDLHVDGLVVN